MPSELIDNYMWAYKTVFELKYRTIKRWTCMSDVCTKDQRPGELVARGGELMVRGSESQIRSLRVRSGVRETAG